MEEKTRLLSLTRISFLNALVFSLLALQYSMPLSILILIWVLPVIFALEIYYVSPRMVFSNSLGLFVASLLLGLDIAVWTAVYFFVGVILGSVWRAKTSAILRLIATGIAFGLALLGMGVAFILIARVDLLQIEDIFVMLEGLKISSLSPLATLTAGSIVAIMLLSMGTNGFLGRILRHLETEEPKWEKNNSNATRENKI